MSDFYKIVVLRNFKAFKKSEESGVLENAIPLLDEFLLQSFHTDTVITDNFLKENKDIENYEEIKRLNDKYRRLVEIEINSRITE